jgi:hypothetical protein
MRRSYESQGRAGQTLNLDMLFSAKCIVRINLLRDGLGLLCDYAWLQPPMCRAARQQEELTNENHRYNLIVRFCSQDC